MTKFIAIVKVIKWAIIICIGVLTFLAPSLFIVRQVSNWSVGSNWAIGPNWTVGSDSVATPLSIEGIIEVFKKTVDFLSEGNVAIPTFIIGMTILSLIYKRREIITRLRRE
jgi:hypothetical protein